MSHAVAMASCIASVRQAFRFVAFVKQNTARIGEKVTAVILINFNSDSIDTSIDALGIMDQPDFLNPTPVSNKNKIFLFLFSFIIWDDIWKLKIKEN